MRRHTYSQYTPKIGPILSGHERVAVEEGRSCWGQGTLFYMNGDFSLPATNGATFCVRMALTKDIVIHKYIVTLDSGYAQVELRYQSTPSASGWVGNGNLPVRPLNMLSGTIPALRGGVYTPSPVVTTGGTITNGSIYMNKKLISFGTSRSMAKVELPTKLGISNTLIPNLYFLITVIGPNTTTGTIYIEFEENLESNP